MQDDSRKISTITKIITNVRDASVLVTVRTSPEEFNTANGFIIDNNYVICPSSLFQLRNRKPYVCSVAYVTTGTTYCSPAKLLTLDGAGNIAILKLETPSKLTHLTWGKSRSVSVGSACLVIGSLTSYTDNRETSENVVDILTIADNRYVDYGEGHRGELLLLSRPLTGGLGAVVLDCQGQIIGMALGGRVVLAEKFISLVFKSVRTRLNNCVDLASPLIYIKSFLGVRARPVVHSDLCVLDTEATEPLMVGGYILTHNFSGADLQEGDIILSLTYGQKNYLLGDRKNQVSPTLVMWTIVPDSEIILGVRKLGRYQDVVLFGLKTRRYPEDRDEAQDKIYAF